MSFDNDFRPQCYGDVLGQESTIKILRNIVATGRGFRTSYLFCGPWGSGKTTLGRILARALLCHNPTPEGDPCDACPSCKSLLEKGTSVDFIEVDAATNSGKEHIDRIKEEIQYATFSGRRPVYLFDEAHRLSPGALDALLLPMEEFIAGTDDKKLVCIFCTTEPEKMHKTVLSRCAPAFVIQPVEPAIIAERLKHICEQQSLEFDPEMLQVIAEMSECHIRDAIKAVEGVSMLGAINRENVTSYLHLDMGSQYLRILASIGADLEVAIETTKKALERSSPSTCYKKLAEIALVAFQFRLGIKPPSYLDASVLEQLGEKHGGGLLGFAKCFSSRPGKPTPEMLLCDISYLHYGGVPTFGVQPVVSTTVVGEKIAAPPVQPVEKSGKVTLGSCGGEVQKDPRAIRDRSKKVTTPQQTQDRLSVPEFSRYLALLIAERDEANSGSPR